MRKGKKRLAIRGLALLMTMVLAVQSPALAFADGGANGKESIQEFENRGEMVVETLADNEELFAGYFQKKVEETTGYGTAQYGTQAREELSSVQKAIYDELKQQIIKVAAGEISSTEFTIPETICNQISITGSNFVANGNFTEEAKTSFAEKVEKSVGAKTLMCALLADLPYEMYWFDKTTGISASYAYSGNSTQILLKEYTFSFAVAKEYALNNMKQTTETDTAKTGATTNALQKAKEVVASFAGNTDITKLEKYKEWICQVTSYNSDAADDKTDTPYGNPWQVIYVFDENSSTNVVCEGYAKAFQLLCDLTKWEGEVVSYCVSGTMDGGAHMWNVLAMDGDNYLIDVTNSDEGTVGKEGGLFLDNVITSSAKDYSWYTLSVGGRSITYVYDEGQKDLYCDGYLELTVFEREVVELDSVTKVYDGNAQINEVTFISSNSGKQVLLQEGVDYYLEDACFCDVSTGNEDANVGTKKLKGNVNLTFAGKKKVFFENKATTCSLTGKAGTITLCPVTIKNPKLYINYDDTTYFGIQLSDFAPNHKGVTVSGNLTVVSIEGDTDIFEVTPASQELNYQLKSSLTAEAQGKKMTVKMKFQPDNRNYAVADSALTIEVTGKTVRNDIPSSLEKTPTYENVGELIKVEPVKGRKYTSDDASGVYRIISTNEKSRTVSYVSPVNKKTASVTIPAVVVISGKSYKVTEIEKKALQNLKAKKITIGKNVKKIGTKAFYRCSKVKTITIKTTKLKLKSIGSKAFAKTPKKVTVKLPKKKFKNYKKVLIKRGIHKKAKFKK